MARFARGRRYVGFTISSGMDKAIAPLLLDYERAAAALSLSRAALRDLVYKGRGPAQTRIGRRVFFAVGDLEAFVERHREPAPPPPTPAPRMRKRGRPTIAEQMARNAAFTQPALSSSSRANSSAK